MNRGDRAEYDGHEVLLWPLEFINLTATPDSINHTVPQVTNSGLWDNGHTDNIDVWPLYAPCTMELLFSYSTGTINGHTQVWRSVNPVRIPESDTPVYVTMGFGHADNLIYTIAGTVITQGTHFYDTGTYGLGSGAHVHMILYIGQRSNMFPTGYNSYVAGNIWYSDNAPQNIATFFYTLPSDIRINTLGLNFIDYNGAIHTGGVNALLYYLMLRKNKRRLKVYDTA